MRKFTFGKEERLSSKSIISRLFQEGQSQFKFPVKVQYQLFHKGREGASYQASVSVSKRFFKRAVDRNLIKRRMREAYRLNKHHLTETELPADTFCALMFIYSGKEMLSYSHIEQSIVKLLYGLRDDIKRQ